MPESRSSKVNGNSTNKAALKARDRHDPHDRRHFLRQSAEVAALSLFGVMGLDAVVQRVAQRIETMRGIDGVADRIIGRAYASDGTVQPDEADNMLTAMDQGCACQCS